METNEGREAFAPARSEGRGIEGGRGLETKKKKSQRILRSNDRPEQKKEDIRDRVFRS